YVLAWQPAHLVLSSPGRPMTAAEFQSAGLYDPAAPEAPARLELLEWLAAQGVTLADMREAQLRWGSLTGLAGDLALRAGERLTLAEVAARSGMSPERIERFNLAAAFPPVGPEERVFDPGTVAMFARFAAAEQFRSEERRVGRECG